MTFTILCVYCSEMEDKGYVVLSTLINLRYFKKDEEIFAKGSASENSFIVMRGLVKVCYCLLH